MIYKGETSKAFARRIKEDFFKKYCQGKGIDIGCGQDPITPNCDKWDQRQGQGDATLLENIPDNSYDFVYSSHCLEDMNYPELAMKNWFRIVKPGRYLIITVPHRDLYEKKRLLPSNWNYDHKMFFLIDRDDPPHTFGLVPMVTRTLVGYRIIYIRECNDGWENLPSNVHSVGEYSIEMVIRKND